MGDESSYRDLQKIAAGSTGLDAKQPKTLDDLRDRVLAETVQKAQRVADIAASMRVGESVAAAALERAGQFTGPRAQQFEEAYRRGAADAEARFRAESDDHASRAFHRGVAIGRAEGEAAQPFDFSGEQAGPNTYDAAVEALHVAGQMVRPVIVERIDQHRTESALAAARLTTDIADELLRWLSEHVEHADTDLIDGQPGVHPSARDRTTCCGASAGSHFGDCAELQKLAALAEMCPECRAGKCGNCPGRVLAGDGDDWMPCPCPDDAHTPGGRVIG